MARDPETRPRREAPKEPKSEPRPTLRVDVLAIVDGDTFVAREQGKLYLLRLEGIDAPELDQSFGEEAKDWLSARLLRRRIVVRPSKGGGCIVPVEVKGSGDKSLNELQLEAGVAWAEETAPDAWKRLETKARYFEVGLWGGARPLAPWEFRARTME